MYWVQRFSGLYNETLPQNRAFWVSNEAWSRRWYLLCKGRCTVPRLARAVTRGTCVQSMKDEAESTLHSTQVGLEEGAQVSGREWKARAGCWRVVLRKFPLGQTMTIFRRNMTGFVEVFGWLVGWFWDTILVCSRLAWTFSVVEGDLETVGATGRGQAGTSRVTTVPFHAFAFFSVSPALPELTPHIWP